MDLDWSPEQVLLRDAVRSLCARHAGLAVVRQLEDDPIGYPAAFQRQLADAGLLGLRLPERFGGSAMSMLDSVIVYTEFGRALAPTPHLVSSVLAGGLLARAGTPAQQDRWLPAIAGGTAVLGVAWLEPERGFGPRGVALPAEPCDGGLRLTGTKRHVSYARAADRLVVAVALPGGEPGFVLVDPAAPGVTLTQQFSVASDTQYRVDFADVAVAAEDVLPATWADWDAVLTEAAVLLAAAAAGGARYALEITVDYAKNRRQFDKPLGAFQALAHYLADAVTAVDGAETLVWEAAWAADAGLDDGRLAPMAKLFACRTFRDVTATAQQIFGGIGFTVDYDIQLYFRRAKALQLSWWDTRFLEQRVAAAVLGEARVAGAPTDRELALA